MDKMRKNNKMYCLIYRLRKSGGEIDTRTRTVFYHYQEAEKVQIAGVKRLCDEFGFGRQSSF